MNFINILPLALGIVLFSFLITSVALVPFIDFLYKLKMTRQKEAPKKGKIPLFDKLHDKKAGTPVGGGVLLIIIVSLIFILMFPIAAHMGVYIKSSYNFGSEMFVIIFTFVSFGILGLSDDIMKIFGKGKTGNINIGGLSYGFSRKQKFILQWILAFIVSYTLYHNLGIHILHIPLFNKIIDFGVFYVPFSALIIVIFSNAFNITDGLDGLSCGLLLISLIAFGAITGSSLDTPLSLFIALWIGALIAFLYFNVWPARLFLGDTGALSFGAMLAVIGLITGSVIALFVIGAIFLIEIISSAIQILGWKYLKKPVFPLAPIHHTFLAIGWEEPKIVMRAYFAQLILAVFGLWLSYI
jgi:phospho-N-acetylmuramoyl-pentapeptide-transferase